MKVSVQNEIREKYLKLFKGFAIETLGEDCDDIATNSFNFPIVTEDGEEGSVEIVVKIPKEDECYSKREDYKLKLAEKEEKAREKEIAKQKKIEKDRKRREEKELAKQNKGE